MIPATQPQSSSYALSYHLSSIQRQHSTQLIYSCENALKRKDSKITTDM